MSRAGAMVAVGIVMGLAAVGCSENETSAPTTRPPRTTTTTASTCSDDPVFHDDDVPAADALINASQLPAGDWTATTACRWSTSGHDLLSNPECAASAGDAAAAQEERTGYARATWVQADGAVRLDHRMELYGSARKPGLIPVLFAGPGLADCFAAAMRKQAAGVSNTTVRAIEVMPYDVGLRPGELGADFFVRGVSISMTVESNGTNVPMAIRVVMLRAGGGLATMTVGREGRAGSRPDLDGIDLVPTVRAAGRSFLASFGLTPP